MNVWTIANQKGGVGKTTTVAALAGLLAQDGKRVLMVDLDPQASLSQYFGLDPDGLSLSVYHLFAASEPVTAEQVRTIIQPTRFEHLHILPSMPLLATVEKLSAVGGGKGLVLKQAIDRVAVDYDYVLVDTPPTLGVLLVNALACADRLIIPVQTEYLALRGLERMMRTLTMIGKSQQREIPYVVVPTLFDRRTQASVTCLQLLRDQYAGRMSDSVVGVDTRFRDASRAGVPPSLLAESRGVVAYRELLERELLAG